MTVANVLLCLLGARVVVWLVLQIILYFLDRIVRVSEAIVETHGPTVGALRKAGQEDRFNRMCAIGGWLYVLAVPLAAFLLWWPIGTLFRAKMIRQIYSEVGQWLTPEQEGSYHIA